LSGGPGRAGANHRVRTFPTPSQCGDVDVGVITRLLRPSVSLVAAGAILCSVLASGPVGAATAIPVTGTWAPAPVLSNPAGRAGAASAFDATRKNTVVFGGTDGRGPLSDTWTFDGSRWTWQSLVTAPAPRSGAAMAFD